MFIDTPFGRVAHVPFFCANCGFTDGRLVTEDSTFIAWLCPKCEVHWAPLLGTMAVPDEVFFARMKEAQIEKYGRVLSFDELAAAVSDDSNILSKLAREAPGRN